MKEVTVDLQEFLVTEGQAGSAKSPLVVFSADERERLIRETIQGQPSYEDRIVCCKRPDVAMADTGGVACNLHRKQGDEIGASSTPCNHFVIIPPPERGRTFHTLPVASLGTSSAEEFSEDRCFACREAAALKVAAALALHDMKKAIKQSKTFPDAIFHVGDATITVKDGKMTTNGSGFYTLPNQEDTGVRYQKPRDHVAGLVFDSLSVSS